MKKKELVKTSMMISNWKNPLVYKKIFLAFQGLIHTGEAEISSVARVPGYTGAGGISSVARVPGYTGAGGMSSAAILPAPTRYNTKSLVALVCASFFMVESPEAT